MNKTQLLAGKCLFNQITGEKHRILYVSWDENVVFAIEMGQKIAYPEALVAETLLDADFDILEESDTALDISGASEKQKAAVESRWNLIKDFVLNEPVCYQKKVRSTFAAQAAEQEHCTVFRINQILYHYWQGGKSKSALLPETNLRGGKGKTKTGSVGRKPKYDVDRVRHVMTEMDIQNIQEAVNKTYNKNQKYSFVDGYSELLKKYTADDRKTLLNSYPTKSQFMYQAQKMIDIKKRYGTRAYAKDIKGHLGNIKNEARGPGDKYQVDATVGDIYLVSASDPHKIIGRPTIYSVTDVYSRMIVGIYVGLENASWSAARKALYNAFRDKIAYCKYFGIDIQESDWPCKGVPHTILADNGEFNSFQSDDLVAGLGVNLENAAPWRADQKSVVEQSFHQLNLLTKAHLPGAVINTVRTRGDEDYKKAARLTLYEYTQILIRTVLYRNSTPLSRQPVQDQDYIEAGILPTPNNIWQWGMENRTGGLTIKSDHDLWLALLPKEQATITRQGIKYKNLYFSCNTAGLENWFDSIGGRLSEKCPLIIDPDNMGSAHVVLPSGVLEQAVRTDGSKYEYQHWTEDDLDLFIHAERERQSKSTRETDQKKQDYNAAIAEIISGANARFNSSGTKTVTKKQTGTQIRKNKEDEQKVLPFPSEERINIATGRTHTMEISEQSEAKTPNSLNKKLKQLMEEDE